jgi:hypothetical protein
MELKNVNLLGDNVVASNLSNINFTFLFENCENESKNERCMIFFPKNVVIA